MIQNITKFLIKAVKEKRCVAIRYRKQKDIRVMEPHAIYTNNRGEVVVEGFQTRGHSASGRTEPFWRPFRIQKISAISVLKESFEPRVKEGFVSNRPRYCSGLLAIVDTSKKAPTFLYSDQALQQMGPFLSS